MAKRKKKMWSDKVILFVLLKRYDFSFCAVGKDASRVTDVSSGIACCQNVWNEKYKKKKYTHFPS